MGASELTKDARHGLKNSRERVADLCHVEIYATRHTQCRGWLQEQSDRRVRQNVEELTGRAAWQTRHPHLVRKLLAFFTGAVLLWRTSDTRNSRATWCTSGW